MANVFMFGTAILLSIFLVIVIVSEVIELVKYERERRAKK